jgi:hypothetical protein
MRMATTIDNDLFESASSAASSTSSRTAPARTRARNAS